MKFLKHSLPFLDANSVLVLKDVLLALPLDELEGALASIQYPTQDFFMLTPSPFTLQKFLFGYGFFVLHCYFVWSQEDSIHCVHDALVDISAVAPGALCNPDKIINKYIHVCNRSPVFHE